MDVIEKLLDSSKKLNYLLKEIPEESFRDDFIETIDSLIEYREQDLQRLLELSKDELRGHPLAPTLFELDQQIKEQLEKIMNVIKKDIRDFQTKRKSNVSYSNPYAATQSIDGKYYDRKK